MNYNNKYPEYWEGLPLIKLVETFETGARPKGGVSGIENGIPSLGGEHLDNNGKFKFEKIKYVPEEFAQLMKKGIIQPQDILLVKDGATTGKVSFVNDSFPFKYAVINEHLFLIRCLDIINSKFVYYYLFSPIGQKDVQDNFKGSAQGGINHSFSKNTIIPLPPLNEQNRIVEKLDALFARIDNIKERMETIPELIKQFRQSVLHAAVTGKLTEEWRSFRKLTDWKYIELEKVANVIDPQPSHRTPPIFEGGIPYISIKDVDKEGNICLNNARLVSEDVLQEHINRYDLKEGDFGFGKIGTLGKPFILPIFSKRKYTLSANIILVQPRNEGNPKFLFYYLDSPIIESELQKQAKATSQAAFGIKKARKFPVPLPLPIEQNEIVRRVDNLLLLASKIEKQYHIRPK